MATSRTALALSASPDPAPGSDSLGRYYTRNGVSQFLVDQMPALQPRRILDLGAGAGALSVAALTRWQAAELVTVDIDSAVRVRLNQALRLTRPGFRHEHLKADALSNKLPALIGVDRRAIDAAICNPPFIIPQWRRGFATILEEAGFSGCLPTLYEVDAALLFLAQNLRLLSQKGTVGIILPDSLISASRYRSFRREVLTRYCVDKVIRLPRGSFSNTDALAHILVVNKGGAAPRQIPLYCLSDEHRLSDPLQVEIDEAIDRLDFQYHANRQRYRFEKPTMTLANVGAEIKRGTLNSAEHHEASFATLHTTEMPAKLAGKWCDFTAFGRQPRPTTKKRHLVEAAPGDILLSRVGRNLESKILGVESGYPILTDCVIRLRLPLAFRQKALDQLSSDAGRAFLASRAYGVGARQLTKTDLLDFPLDI